MPAILNDLLMLVLATTVGGFAGYFYRASPSPADNSTSPSLPKEEPKPNAADESREFLLSVQQVAQAVAAGVGDHGQQVRHFNTQLRDNGSDVATVLAKLIHANEQMAEQLSDAQTRLKNQSRMIDLHIAESHTDALTGLSNRRAFNDDMLNHLSQFEKYGTPVSVLMLDIDYFKKLNDVHGHLVGDDILMSVGRTIRQHIRSGDVAARYGGEEFAVILPRTTAEQAREVAERIRGSISQAVSRISNRSIRITASAGLSQLLPGDSIKTWLHRADESLYFSKDSGRDCGHWNDGRIFKPFVQTDRTAASPLRLPSIEAAKVATDAHSNTADSEDLLDPTTQLLSTDAFNKYFARGLAESRRTGVTMSVIMIRVDRYGEFSDRYGVNSDGLVLRIIGRMLTSSVRSSDYVARYGNDSFAIILPNANLTNATQVAERIRAGVEKMTITLAKDELNFTISIGAGEERGSDGTAPLIDRVKRAVAIAASRGGNQIVASGGEGYERVPLNSPEGSAEFDDAYTRQSPSSQPVIKALASDMTNTAPMDTTFA